MAVAVTDANWRTALVTVAFCGMYPCRGNLSRIRLGWSPAVFARWMLDPSE
jgi:hypothetical protein